MAQAIEPSRHRWETSWANWIIAWVVGPVVTWGMDILQGIRAEVPLRGLCGTPSAAVVGLVTSAGVYLAVFLGVRFALEIPRWVAEIARGAPVPVPPLLVAALSLILIAYLDL